MIKEYLLKEQGMQFKADFNWNYELFAHILDIRTQKGYIKIDLVQDKNKVFHLTKRVANFENDKALFEIRELNVK